MRLEANAKINIGLIVGERRSDGYHSIETIMARLALADIIHAELSPSPVLSVTINGNEGYLRGGTDLMEKAALSYAEASDRTFHLDISIEKHIPVMAGLGGGSSDAASVLLFLESSFGNLLGKERLFDAAASVGSDVPFFISGAKGAIVRGRGEIIEETEVPSGLSVLLSASGKGISTAEAYAALDSIARPERHLGPISVCFPTRTSHPNDFELVAPAGAAFPIASGELPEGTYISMTGSGDVWFALLPPGSPKFDNPEKYGIVSSHII